MNRRASYNSDFPPDLTEDEINSIKYSSWDIDCPRMILRSCASQNPATYYGAGKISQSIEGYLEFKIYANREKNTPKHTFISPVKSGELVPDSEFYELAATDSLAREWHASRFLPSFYQTATGKTIADGELFEVYSSGKYPDAMKLKGCDLQLWVFDNLRIPWNATTEQRKSVARGRQRTESGTWNAWKFRCMKTDFLLVKEADDLLTIQASNNEKKFPGYFDNRVIEALQFLLGRPVQWSVMKKRTGKNLKVVVRSKRLKSIRGRFQPPLPSRSITNPKTGKLTANFHRTLFERFLKHTLYHEKPRHPLWGKLDAIFEASSASFIDAEALTLTVAIESILASEFTELGSPSKKEEAAIREAIDYIKSWDGNEKIKNRIMGLVSNLLQTRALDRMRKLEKIGAITEEQYRAWQKLRNPSTHSYQDANIPTAEHIQLLQECEVLFYHLIFHAIGYKGPYTDFSVPGWPLKKYPERNSWV
jgi:hypothetical protein